MLVALLHNAVSPGSSPDERDVLVQLQVVQQALADLGHQGFALPCTLDLESLREQLVKTGPETVFNLVEALGGFDRLMHLPIALLAALDIPYSGPPAESIMLANDKLLAKHLLRQSNLPTPDWICADDDSPGVCTPGGLPAGGGRTYIIKAIHEHASYGMDATSLVCDSGVALRDRLRAWHARWKRPCFAEAFIQGREFNLSLLANPLAREPEVLPVAEIDFSAFPPDTPRVVGYDAKWNADSFEFAATPRRFDFPPADDPLLERLRALACSCWHVFRLRGFARVDFRVDREGQPWILEINVNPCLSPDAGFAAALERARIPFAGAIERILASSLPLSKGELEGVMLRIGGDG